MYFIDCHLFIVDSRCQRGRQSGELPGAGAGGGLQRVSQPQADRVRQHRQLHPRGLAHLRGGVVSAAQGRGKVFRGEGLPRQPRQPLRVRAAGLPLRTVRNR